jgi:hypothetical protein
MTARRHTTRLGALAAVGLLAASMITALTGPVAHAAKPKAKPAAGSVAFGCNLQPFDSDFDYTAKTSVAAKKAKPKAAVAALTARLSDMPGISPVAVSGEMTATLSLKVGGKATTLKGKISMDVPANAPIPVPKLTGKVKVAKAAKKLPVVVTGLTFDLASFGVSGTCAPESGATLSKLKLG